MNAKTPPDTSSLPPTQMPSFAHCRTTQLSPLLTQISRTPSRNPLGCTDFQKTPGGRGPYSFRFVSQLHPQHDSFQQLAHVFRHQWGWVPYTPRRNPLLLSLSRLSEPFDGGEQAVQDGSAQGVAMKNDGPDFLDVVNVVQRIRVQED